MSTLEEDILKNEFGRDANIMDAVVINDRQKPKRAMLPILVVGTIVVSIALGVLFFSEIKSSIVGKNAEPVVSAPVIKAAALPPEVLEDAAQQNGDEVSQAQTANGQTALNQAEVPVVHTDKDVKDPVVLDPVTVTPSPNFASNPAKTESVPPVKPGADSKMVVATQNTAAISTDNANQERYDALDRKIGDLLQAMADLNKRVDALASETKENASKAQAAIKTANIEQKRTSNQPQVTKSMKELHIVALLSDGVVFEGDNAISVGQYAKHLNGKIISVNTEQNIITTDKKVFKVL